MLNFNEYQKLSELIKSNPELEHHPTNDCEFVYASFPPHYLAIHRHRLSQLPGRINDILLSQRSFRRSYHLLFHHYIRSM